jgi:4-amino-4-deoxy-L-arabinose transferase-like glycosyltransferase
MFAVARWWRSEDDSQRRARLFLWLWGGLVVLFVSLSSTKTHHLRVAGLSCLRAIAGRGREYSVEGSSEQEQKGRGLEWAVLGLGVVLNFVLVFAARKALTSGRALPHVRVPLTRCFSVAFCWSHQCLGLGVAQARCLYVSLVQVATMTA